MLEPFPYQSRRRKRARVYANQIVTWHGTGSKLITDQGRAFMFSFFWGTRKTLGGRRVNTSSYHPATNEMIERWDRYLHADLSHYVNSTNTNWDVLLHFILWPTLWHQTRLPVTALCIDYMGGKLCCPTVATWRPRFRRKPLLTLNG
jgi:hypothetical protein